MAGGPSTPELVVAAAEVGSLGFVAAGYKAVDELADQVEHVRRATSCFGVNVFAPNAVPVDAHAFAAYVDALRPLAAVYDVDLTGVSPRDDDDGWHDKIDLLLSDPVPVVSFTFGLPDIDVVRGLHQAGSLVLQTVTTEAEAEQAAARGVHGLVVQSARAGGHLGTFTPHVPVETVPADELVRRVRSRVDLPIWAAGGISSPADVGDVLAAGAEAAVVGTVLLRSPESGASRTYRDALADPARTETVVTRAFSGRPARGLRNRFIDELGDRAPLGYPAVHHLTSPIRKAAAAAGDPENINIWAGTGHAQATGEPVADILLRLAG